MVTMILLGAIIGGIIVADGIKQFFSSIYGNAKGSADAEYRNPVAIPGDNGSVYIAWYSNAGWHYTDSYEYDSKIGTLNIAKVDSSGKLLFNHSYKYVTSRHQQYDLSESRFQDGYLFAYPLIPSVVDSSGNLTTDLNYTTWNGGRIYHLPGGPLVFPWGLPPANGGTTNDGLADPSGNITFVFKSAYSIYYNGRYQPYGKGLNCSIINSQGQLLVNQTPLPIMDRWLFVPDAYGITLDKSAHLAIGCIAGPDEQQSNTTHFVLNIFNANLTLAVNVSADQIRDDYEDLHLLDIKCVGDGHFRFLLSKFYSKTSPTNKWQYRTRLDLVDLNFTGGQKPSLRTMSLVDALASSPLSGVMSPDGQIVHMTYLSKGELYLKSLDLSGRSTFKDLRLTPTNDKYSWNYPTPWG